mmetsp:Transcript_43359/g.119975  ORF Transcript_43359/g.119975 Transcript_43359/m.119975 type:complete len:242 (+) Transcript_43359:421-1146(+)
MHPRRRSEAPLRRLRLQLAVAHGPPVIVVPGARQTRDRPMCLREFLLRPEAPLRRGLRRCCPLTDSARFKRVIGARTRLRLDGGGWVPHSRLGAKFPMRRLLGRRRLAHTAMFWCLVGARPWRRGHVRLRVLHPLLGPEPPLRSSRCLAVAPCASIRRAIRARPRSLQPSRALTWSGAEAVFGAMLVFKVVEVLIGVGTRAWRRVRTLAGVPRPWPEAELRRTFHRREGRKALAPRTTVRH